MRKDIGQRPVSFLISKAGSLFIQTAILFFTGAPSPGLGCALCFGNALNPPDG